MVDVAPLLLLVVEFHPCVESCPGSVGDEVPAAVKEEAGPPPVGLEVQRRLDALQMGLADGGLGWAVLDNTGGVEGGGDGDGDGEEGPGSYVVGHGTGGVACCARHHPAKAPRAYVANKVASMP